MPARKRKTRKQIYLKIPIPRISNPPLDIRNSLKELGEELDKVLDYGVPDSQLAEALAKTFTTDMKGRGYILALKNALRNAQKSEVVNDD